MSKQIEVWCDATSDTDEVWCVSLCDDDGQEVKCLSTHDDKDDAIDAGKEAAQKWELRLCERSKHGPITEIFSAHDISMQAMLLGHGDKFSGNHVEDQAENWIDHDFDAGEADGWCEIGVWDAATAASFRDAGLTPKKVRDASESLTEGLDDPGDPIYAACNGDISPQVIIEAAGSTDKKREGKAP